MAATTDDLIFRGANRDDDACEEFIFTIRRWAFAKELSEDDGLVARYASVCIAGDALRFYETLDEDVQRNWKLLRQALLARYPAQDPTLPAPAPASSHRIGDMRTGIIRVLVDGDSRKRYLSHSTNGHGSYYAKEDISVALVLRFRRSSDLQPLRILNSCTWLGLIWKQPHARCGPANSSFAFPTCLGDAGSPLNCQTGTGPSQWIIWKYIHPSKSLGAFWFEESEGKINNVELQVGVDSEDTEVGFFADVKGYSTRWNNARFVLQEMEC